MKIVRIAFLAVMAASLAGLSLAQQTQPPEVPPSSQAQPSPPLAQGAWVPQGIEALRQSASSKTEFTLDHSMLVFASKLSPDSDDLRRVIAGVSGISVHNFRFSGRWIYDPQALSALKDEYHAAGWTQLMNNHDKDGGATNLWIRYENNAVTNIAILSARASEVDFFVVSGSISPVDLSHLGGHFGIPKIEGGVTVPNTHRP
ncbi:MAG: DUF4252 domain-containing protein [Terriglobales bacterium]